MCVCVWRECAQTQSHEHVPDCCFAAAFAETDLVAGDDLDEATLERMLVEEADSEDEEDDDDDEGSEVDGRGGAGRDQDIDTSVFAAAEDFAQLLEEGEEVCLSPSKCRIHTQTQTRTDRQTNTHRHTHKHTQRCTPP